jgi:hypothetical protein
VQTLDEQVGQEPDVGTGAIDLGPGDAVADRG